MYFKCRLDHALTLDHYMIALSSLHLLAFADESILVTGAAVLYRQTIKYNNCLEKYLGIQLIFIKSIKLQEQKIKFMLAYFGS